MNTRNVIVIMSLMSIIFSNNSFLNRPGGYAGDENVESIFYNTYWVCQNSFEYILRGIANEKFVFMLIINVIWANENTSIRHNVIRQKINFTEKLPDRFEESY